MNTDLGNPRAGDIYKNLETRIWYVYTGKEWTTDFINSGFGSRLDWIYYSEDKELVLEMDFKRRRLNS